MIRFSLTDAKRINELIRKRCCNYNDGNCILLDNGDSCVCLQTISYSMLCKWFRTAVLPNDSELYIRLMKPKNIKKCSVCGNNFLFHSNRAKYCNSCKTQILRRQKANYQAKRRKKQI